MNKSQAIFQEIENKLVKDDYASSLPTYHPAKGRRKRIQKESEKVYATKGKSSTELEGKNSGEALEGKGIPDTSPEIEDPDEEEIPGEEPYPEYDDPGEEEIPGEMPEPEYDDPDEEEFDR